MKKGPGGRSANAAIPCAPDVFARLRAEADVVITGAADCGSCTAYSVHDTVELERCGIPTVLLTTTRFRPVVDRARHRDSGLPEIRTLVVDHPIGGVDRETLHRRAESATDELIALLSTAGLVAGRRSLARASGRSARRISAQLVASDGADLEIDRLRRRRRSVAPSPRDPRRALRRVRHASGGAESIAAARLAGTRCAPACVIEDPREGGDPG